MASMTYLQLVNKAIAESKVSVDPLTSANFASPPRTMMYDLFKGWINDAYEELLMDRPEWMFRVERAVVSIWPRVIIAGLTYTPAVGDVLIGASSGVIMTVRGVHGFEEAEQNLGSEMTLSVEFDSTSDPTSLILRESINRTAPTAATAVGYVLGHGRYSFGDVITGLQDIDMHTVKVHRTPANAVLHDGTFINNTYLLQAVEWFKWTHEYELYPWSGTFPKYISRSPQGGYALYPQPEGEMLMSFDYRRKIQQMVLHSDIPEGLPEEYQEYLAWKAVLEYADFDGNPKLYSRAIKHVERYRSWLERDQLPNVRIAGWNGVILRGR